MTEELTKTRLYIKTPLNHTKSSGLPLVNLDWGSTNLPVKKVDERVSQRLWAIHGNPGSCGSYTGWLSKNVVEDTSRAILKYLGVRGKIYYGGAGATHWLNEISDHHRDCRLLLVQKESHDALTRGWSNIDRYDNRYMDMCTWVRKMSIKYRADKIVLGITLSSHLTGTGFEDSSGLLDYCKDLGVRVMLDATCYLAHTNHPEIPHFDYLVFSPHKLPGGPGSSGVMVTSESVTWVTESGSQNIPSIIRIDEVIKLFKEIKEPSNVNERIISFRKRFGELKEGPYSIVCHSWDESPIKEPHYSFNIVWKSPDMHSLQVHPNLVALICTHIYGMQIRGGGLCAERFITNGAEGVMMSGVCRISIPRYLFTEELTDMLLEKFSNMLKYMNYYVRCYFIGKSGGWEVRPEIIANNKEAGSQTHKSCCHAPSATFSYEKGKEDILRGGMMVIDWMFPDTWNEINRSRDSDEYINDPDRWFLHPEDLRSCEPEI